MWDNTGFGSRSFLPVFAGVWNKDNFYEPYTCVTWKGNSYISKTFVTDHTDIQNDVFWTLYG